MLLLLTITTIAIIWRVFCFVRPQFVRVFEPFHNRGLNMDHPRHKWLSSESLNIIYIQPDFFFWMCYLPFFPVFLSWVGPFGKYYQTSYRMGKIILFRIIKTFINNPPTRVRRYKCLLQENREINENVSLPSCLL